MGELFKKTKLILLLIVAVAVFLRLWRLDEVPVSLFSDELDVGYQAYSILETGKDYFGNPWPLQFHSYADTRTPLYIYSSVPSVWAFGISPWGVRLPAAVFGILGVWAMYLLVREMTKNEKWALIASGVLAISPWHIQYSRAAFEASMLLAFLLFGLYFFFKALNVDKWLWVSVVFLASTAWIYSTAKLFTPLLIVFLFVLFKRQITKMARASILKTLVAGVIVGLPLVLAIFTSGGPNRFSYISVFTDPTVPTETEFARLSDVQVEGVPRSLLEKVDSWIIHNKYSYWTAKVVENYYKAFSSEFLFIEGDLNLRHSVHGVGQLYKIEAVALILGAILFFGLFKDKKLKALIFFWLIVGALPAAITREGGGHATRLILILPPLVFLVSYGLASGLKLFGPKLNVFLRLGYLVFLVVSFWSYQHLFWVHNPWYSERSWHAGYKQAIEMAKKYEGSYQKIVISDAQDQPFIFFAAYYPVSPAQWQKVLSEGEVEGFGNLKHFGKYYFGQVGSEGLGGLSKFISEDTIYIASQREWESNLIRQPENKPSGLRLLGTVSLPSGEPAFYAFAKEEN
jgi:4-amino-4-deoxy-L-arabinose transferase-like glycosyltransferase